MLLDRAIDLGIADGDLLFFSGRSLFGRLIRWYTQSVYSHVAVVLWVNVEGTRRLCAFESMEGHGVRLLPLDLYLQERRSSGELVDWFRLAEESIDRGAMVKSLLGTWGRRYSSPWQFLWSFGWLSRRIRRWRGLPAQMDSSRAFCSWEAAAALIAAGFVPDDALPLDPAEMSPGDVSRFSCLRRVAALTAD